VVTITSAAGCDSTVNLNLTVTSNIQTNLIASICPGQNYTVGNQVFNSAGNYQVLLSSAAGCDSTVNLNLTVTSNIQTNLTASICPGQNYTVGSQVFNSTGNYQVLLSSAAGCDSTVNLNLTVTSNIQTNLTASICPGQNYTVGSQVFNSTGNYQVLLNSAAGCDSTVNLSLTVTPAPVTNLTASICAGQNYTVGSQVFNSTGNYQVLLTSAAGCDSTVNLSLTVNACQIDWTLEAQPVRCFGEPGGAIIIQISTGTAPFTYKWSGPGTGEDELEATGVSQTIDDLYAGTYTVTITDATGYSTTRTIEVTQPASPVAVSLGDDLVIELGTTVDLVPQVAGDIVRYSWGGEGLLCDTCAQVAVSPIQSARYQVTVSDANGCSAADELSIIVEKKRRVYVPNVFSPSSTNGNDRVTVFGDKGVERVHYFAIYDRWGSCVFERKDLVINDLSEGWDGRYKNMAADEAVYVWLLDIEYTDGVREILKGDITLLR
jgi:CHU_C Type IX secretion signal domain